MTEPHLDQALVPVFTERINFLLSLHGGDNFPVTRVRVTAKIRASTQTHCIWCDHRDGEAPTIGACYPLLRVIAKRPTDLEFDVWSWGHWNFCPDILACDLRRAFL